MRLSGTTAILSGGTRGMGEAMVRGIVAEGGRVAFGGRDAEAGERIAAELGERALYRRLDVAQAEDWAALVAAAEDRFGAINALVNNAGLGISHRIVDLTREDFDAMVGVNQYGVLLGIQAVIAPMRRAGKGAIVNIGSAAALRAHSNICAYAGTKAAVVGMSLSAAAELARYNIRVNVVHPGYFDTRLLDESSQGTGRSMGAERTPLGRVARPEEIVGAVTLLLSDESAFVTGAQLTVDGGLTM
ncbi:MAG TPA: glucose 1-dehydrogenase [Sphingobium sp.]